MTVCVVIGNVWATKKDENLCGLKLMVVRQEEPDGEFGNSFVAADIVGAGIGERVLVVGGSAARKAFERDDIPVDAAIVGIIDAIELEESASKGV